MNFVEEPPSPKKLRSNLDYIVLVPVLTHKKKFWSPVSWWDDGLGIGKSRRRRRIVMLSKASSSVLKSDDPNSDNRLTFLATSLPDGWEEHVTEDRQTYFLEKDTGLTTWIDPRLPRNGLDNWWEKRLSSNGKIYYVDYSAKPKTSTWNHPLVGKPAEISFEGKGPLPIGWEIRRRGREEGGEPDDSEYYFNTENGLIIREDPRGARFQHGIANRIVPKKRYTREFDERVREFYEQDALIALDGDVELTVERGDLLRSSFEAVMQQGPEELKKRIVLNFLGEEGVDGGGLLREWFTKLSDCIFDPMHALFLPCNSGCYMRINSGSGINERDLEYFGFIGRLLGIALVHKLNIDLRFVPGVYKLMLGSRKLGLNDLKAQDPELYRSLNWILKNEITDVIDETFTVIDDIFGQLRVTELIRDGSSIVVTEENKKAYVDAVVAHRLQNEIQPQLDALLSGFTSMIQTKECYFPFDASELELLLCGTPEINANDWEANTIYEGYVKSDITIRHFWSFVRSLDHVQRSRLLHFATGVTRAPVGGFRQGWQGSEGVQFFTIKKMGEVRDLPTAHTCAVQLELPPYANFEVLRKKVTFAMQETNTYTKA